jgi:heme-degrading monooxygenase HmoA
MIERHVTFQVLPGKMQEFETFFRNQYAPAMSAQPGFGGAELLQPAEAGEHVLMILRFASAEAAQAWRDSAEHKHLSPTLKSLHQGSELRVYNLLAQHPGA